MSAPKRTAIRAGFIFAFDGRGHRLLRDGVVVIEGDHILHVSHGFDGTVDDTVDARDRILTPGLISTHAHIGGSPLDCAGRMELIATIDDPAVIHRILAHLGLPEARDGPEPAASVSPPRDEQPALPFALP